MPVLHVTPVGDAVHHDTATSEPDCICGPRVQAVRHDDGSIGWLLVHSSLDGRERREREA